MPETEIDAIGNCRHEGGRADCPPSCLVVYGGCFAQSGRTPDKADITQSHDCGSNAPDWCFDGTCSTCVGGHLVSEFVYRHADDGAECLWSVPDQKWFQMHSLYPIRECTRSHGATGERSCSCGTRATSLNPTEVVVHGPKRCTIEPVIPPGSSPADDA